MALFSNLSINNISPMKRLLMEDDDPPGSLPSVEISTEVKTAFASQYLAWKARGLNKDDFLSFLSEAGYSVPYRSLARWVNAVKHSGAVVSQNCAAGRPRCLSEEETHLVVGYVLDRNSKKEEVHLETVRKFISDEFDIELSLRTVLNYLTAQGFSSRVAKQRSGGIQLDLSHLTQIALEWLQTSPLHCPRSLLCSVDFTFTSHRTDRRVSYALRGGPQPQVDKLISRFTNCIITCIWADGINRTPSVLYTYNQDFRLDRPPTARRDAQLEKMIKCLSHFDISPQRVIYIGDEKSERRTYASESPRLLRLFFENFHIPPNCTVLSDNGGSFLEDSVDVLKSIGFTTHLPYPAVVHQFLSPNDNKFHGVAKQKWRNLGLDYSDDVTSSVALLHCLDESHVSVVSWFERNLQLGNRQPSAEAVATLIGDGPIHDHEYYKDCLERFRVYIGIDARGSLPDAPPGLDSSLDGKFWR